MAKRASHHRRSGPSEPEIIPPSAACGITVRIDGNYLRMRAGMVREAVIKTVVPNVLEELLWAATSGQLEALVDLPPCGKLDPLSVAEAISEGLGRHDISAKPAWVEKQDRWGGERLVIKTTWRFAL